LITLPGIADCVVFGIPDDEYGEALMAHVVLESAGRLDAASIIADLRIRIAGYKVPRHIEVVDSLPRDDNGKIARRKIRDAYWQNRRSRI
jgi:long-chain acyl-CoA synthetase